ncbi:hypothetical protein niasHT_007517 [Heterodera trifolii]|uniref:Uncharacterized protein n=1 Tax=Heterodera trifolii TaxID=157864 RepID=A0ABD2LS44_9BILA
MSNCPLAKKVADFQKCSCRGLRYCAVCLGTERVRKRRGDVRTEGDAFSEHLASIFNATDGKAHKSDESNSVLLTSPVALSTEAAFVRSFAFGFPHFCEDGRCFALPGLRLVPDFVTESEEQFLLSRIDGAQWVPSQSGRLKQDYGPRVNFKYQRVNSAKFFGLPDYVDHLLLRMGQMRGEGVARLFDGFRPVELCNLDYSSERLSSIDLHKDDEWIWGERLVSVSLNSDCVFTLEHPGRKLLVFVPVPRRSLLCLSAEVRSEWNHGIFPCHIFGRRVVITLRELASPFLDDPKLFEQFGKDIVQKASLRIKTEAN